MYCSHLNINKLLSDKVDFSTLFKICYKEMLIQYNLSNAEENIEFYKKKLKKYTDELSNFISLSDEDKRRIIRSSFESNLKKNSDKVNELQNVINNRKDIREQIKNANFPESLTDVKEFMFEQLDHSEDEHDNLERYKELLLRCSKDTTDEYIENRVRSLTNDINYWQIELNKAIKNKKDYDKMKSEIEEFEKSFKKD